MFRLRPAVSAALIGAFLTVTPAVVAEDAKPVANWVQQFLSARRLCQAGHLHESEVSYNDLLSTLKSLNASASLVGRAYDELAVVLKVQGRFAEAEKNYLRALQMTEREDGHKGDRMAILLSHLGAFYVETGQLARADQYLADSRDLLGDSKTAPVFCRASLLQNQAVLSFERAMYTDSEQNFREAMRLLRTSGPKDRPQLAIVMANLAQVIAVQGRGKDALPLLQEAKAIFDSIPGQFLSSYYMDLVIDATVQRTSGDMKVAEQSCDHALNIAAQVLTDDNPKLLSAMDVCSAVYKAQHRGKEGKQLAARSTLLKVQLANHSSTGQTVDLSSLMRESAR